MPIMVLREHEENSHVYAPIFIVVLPFGLVLNSLSLQYHKHFCKNRLQ